MIAFRPGLLPGWLSSLWLIFGGGKGQENAVNWSCPYSGIQLLYTVKEEKRSSLSSWSLLSAFVTVRCHLSALAGAALFMPILGWLHYQRLKGKKWCGVWGFFFLFFFFLSFPFPRTDLSCPLPDLSIWAPNEVPQPTIFTARDFD